MQMSANSIDEAIEEALKLPLDAANVKTRPKGRGVELSYIESHVAIREANSVFGNLGWDSETIECRVLSEHSYKNTTKNGDEFDVFEVIAMAKVRVQVGVCYREGVGLGNGNVNDYSGTGKSRMDAYELAMKEAESDARKRALMTFGDRFGLALYDKDQKNVLDMSIVKRIQSAGSLDELRSIGKDVKAADRGKYMDALNERKKELEKA